MSAAEQAFWWGFAGAAAFWASVTVAGTAWLWITSHRAPVLDADAAEGR